MFNVSNCMTCIFYVKSSFLTKMIYSFLKKKLASSRGAPQENDAKFRFAIHQQGIRQYHDNCKIAKCQTVATLTPVLIEVYKIVKELYYSKTTGNIL